MGNSKTGADPSRRRFAPPQGEVCMKGALVTGAGMRIGRAFATALAADGFFVFVHHHRSAAAARETVAAITAAGGKAKAVRADLSSAKQAESLVGRCQAKGVQLTCLVNSASLFELDRAPMATAAGFDRHMAVNLRAPLLLSQALARQLPDQETGLRVAGIAPGLTMRSGSQTAARFAEQHRQNPLGVGVTAEDLVRALRFIVATPSYTGDVLVVDSGEHLTGRPRDIAF